MLYKSEKMLDGSMTFKVIFDDDVAWKIEDVPPWLSSLLTSIVMGTRFRYELIEKYRGKLDETKDSIDQICIDIKEIVLNIEEYASSRGLLEKQNLINGFVGEQQTEIEKMYNQWYDIRDKFLESIEKKDVGGIDRYLNELEQMNKNFLFLACSRFVEVIKGNGNN
jgi:hypothetical protein